jgi:hypothetical protein
MLLYIVCKYTVDNLTGKKVKLLPSALLQYDDYGEA